MDNSYIYTVTQLNNQSSNILKNKFSNIWVNGEISNPKTYPSGYTYFTLKDNKSQVSCITSIRDFDIQDGAKVTLNGDLSIYVVKGNYQIAVHSIYPIGDGELWMKYLALKNKLDKEGLFNISKKKELPKYPKSIGIVTSIEGSVINDIINIINRRAPYLKIIICGSKGSGQKSSDSLAASFSSLCKYNKIDLIIIGRGGGSFEDLMCFNDEILVRKIYKCDIPVISAVGHETDFTLCDFVSDYRASTPSEAAEICCANKNDLIAKINNNYDKIYQILYNQINLNQVRMSKFSSIINKVNNSSIFKYKKNQLKYIYDSFNLLSKNKINYYNLKLSLYSKLLKSIDINKIKKRGFSILRKNNSIMIDNNKLKINDLVDIEMYNGFVKAKVKEIYDKK